MQSSRNTSSLYALGFPDLGLQGRAPLGEKAVAFDPPQERLEEQIAQHPGSGKRMVQMELVDPAHQSQIPG